jgi:hypothetical protein
LGAFLANKVPKRKKERKKKKYLVASDFVGAQTSFAGKFCQLSSPKNLNLQKRKICKI